MDTNSNTRQINTFSRGIDTDTSDSFVSTESYRLANNLRYITDSNSDTGELHLIPGGEQEKITFSGSQFDKCSILATDNIGNYGILIIRKNDSWAVLRVEYENGQLKKDNEGHNAKIIFGWCDEKIGNEYTNKLSTVLNYESEDDIKLYIADGEHQILVINILGKTVYNTLSSITNASNTWLHQPIIKQVITGTLKPALVQYSYQLYQNHGISTSMSPLSKTGVVAQKDQPNGISYDKKSNVGFQVEVQVEESINNKYDRIKLYRIEYQQNGFQPTIGLIYDGEFNSYDFVWNDVGNDPLQIISVEEFNSVGGIEIIPNIIESKDNRLFAANLSYKINKYAKDAKEWDSRAFTSGDTYKKNGNDMPVKTPNGISSDVRNNLKIDISNSNLDLSNVFDSTKWYSSDYTDTFSTSILGGDGVNISYRLNDSFETNIDYFINGSTNSTPSIRLYNQNLIDRTTSLRRDEVYRYGIILYFNNGYKSDAKWIADIRTPDIKNSPITSLSSVSGTTEYNLCAKILRVVFTVRNLPEGCIGYEIVRCNRSEADRSTITQGVISSLFSVADNDDEDTYKNQNMLFPTGYCFVESIGGRVITSHETIKPIYKNDSNYVQLFSPEISYSTENIQQLLKTYENLKISPVCAVFPYGNNESQQIKEGKTVHTPGISTALPSTTDFSKYPDLFSIRTMYTSPRQSYSMFQQEIIGIDDDESYYNQKINDITIGRKRERYTYVKLYNTNLLNSGRWGLTIQGLLNTTIDNCEISSTFPLYSQIITGTGGVSKQRLSVLANSVAIGSKLYIPVSLAQLFDKQADDSYILDVLNGASDDSTELSVAGVPFGISDRSAILYFKNKTFLNTLTLQSDQSNWKFFKSYVVNIKKTVTPYGGYTFSARQNSTYYSHGQYFPSSTNTAECKDGDCFIQCFEFVPMHQWHHPEATHHANGTVIYSVPLETDIDIQNDNGSRFSKTIGIKNNQLLQDQPTDFTNLYQQDKPLYVYNTAYSIDPNVLQFVSDIEDNNTAHHRVHYSNLKSNNERIDQWSVFQPLNYIDVNTKYGEITQLESFHNQLLFWQEYAFGILSVNERVQMSTQNNLPLILGTGGVLDRYDYFTTINGMKPNQFSNTQSYSSVYWWDQDKLKILEYNGKNVTELSTVKNIQNLINRNSNHLHDHPILIYDQQNHEVLFNLFGGDNGIEHETGSVVFSELTQFFTSIYEIDPQFYLAFPSQLYLISQNTNAGEGPQNYKWNYITGFNSKGIITYGTNQHELHPYIKYVVNKDSIYTKVYDTSEFGGYFYGGGEFDNIDPRNKKTLPELDFVFKTPLKQEGRINGKSITNRQYDFRFAIPRSGKIENNKWVTKKWGDRLRGKTMQCEMSSTSNSIDFSLQYIITKYRISWS